MGLSVQTTNQAISVVDQTVNQVVDRDEAIHKTVEMLRTINRLFEFSDFEISDNEEDQQIIVKEFSDLADTCTALVNLYNKLAESDKKYI